MDILRGRGITQPTTNSKFKGPEAEAYLRTSVPRRERIQGRAVGDKVGGAAEARTNRAFALDGVSTHSCVNSPSKISEA